MNSIKEDEHVEFMTVPQAAKMLRCRAARIRRAIDTGDLPAYRLSPCVPRVERGEVLKWARSLDWQASR